MFWLFKKPEAKKHSNLLVLSSSWKKRNFLEFFKINPFILTSFLIVILLTVALQTEITANTKIIKEERNVLATNYAKLIETKNTLGFLNGLKSQQFDWSKIVKILNYLEELNLYEYKLEFNPTKQYFFIHIKSINQAKLDEIIEKWLKSWTLNYFKTNKTLKIIEEWKVSISLIFN